MGQRNRNKGDKFWLGHIHKWEASNKSRTQYCREAGISYWTFREWQKRFQKGNKFVKTMVQVPLEITSESHDTTTSIELIINESIVIRVKSGFDRKLLRAVIQELGADK